MPSQAIHKLLHNQDSYPKISRLMPIAKFFNITIGQLIGEEPLNAADSTVNSADVLKVSRVLRRLLLDNRMRPHELSAALEIPQKTMHQLMHHSEIYPKLSTLLPIARFFKVTIGQLIGEEALESRITDDSSLSLLDNDLYMQCAEHAIQLFKKHNVALNEKLATKVILDIYRYSLRHYKPTVPHYKSTAPVDQAFAHWYVFMCADDTNQQNNVNDNGHSRQPIRSN